MIRDVINYIGQPVSLLSVWLLIGPVYAVLVWALNPPTDDDQPQPEPRQGLLTWTRQTDPEPAPIPIATTETTQRPTPYKRLTEPPPTQPAAAVILDQATTPVVTELLQVPAGTGGRHRAAR